jgi:hypothetical protein
MIINEVKKFAEYHNKVYGNEYNIFKAIDNNKGRGGVAILVHKDFANVTVIEAVCTTFITIRAEFVIRNGGITRM